MKLGMIGTNFVSDWLAEAAKAVPDVEVHAVYSRKQKTGEAFAGKHCISHVYTDYEEFLNSDIDAVYIATPTYVHCPQAMEAMCHKKHVLCEKIMAVNEREAAEMFACAKENQVVLLEAMRPDFDPALDLVKEYLPKIGKLRRVTMEYCQYSSRYDRFREGEILNAFNPELSNAAIMDIGVYCIHTLVRLLGMPKDVKAFSTKLHNGFEGNGIVLMQYGGLTAEAVYSKITESVNKSIFVGEEGSILIGKISMPDSVEIIYRDGKREVLPYVPAENNMVYEVQEFARLVRENRVEHPYKKYSLDTLRVTDEARRQNGIVFQADSVL
ncbi:Gfo/Idh/MocA family protein [Faecalicatena faecalis]|nr:Gfo/Idh/MocA family oxidoreductase [Faecalicatena faecalis]